MRAGRSHSQVAWVQTDQQIPFWWLACPSPSAHAVAVEIGREIDIVAATTLEQWIFCVPMCICKASDIRVPGVGSSSFRDAVLELHCGSVGYYAKSDVVQVDVGRVCRW